MGPWISSYNCIIQLGKHIEDSLEEKLSHLVGYFQLLGFMVSRWFLWDSLYFFGPILEELQLCGGEEGMCSQGHCSVALRAPFLALAQGPRPEFPHERDENNAAHSANVLEILAWLLPTLTGRDEEEKRVILKKNCLFGIFS